MTDSIIFLCKQGVWRWLQSIDMREGSKTYGMADREYWAWKTKDFANGTHQGGLSSFLDLKEEMKASDEQIRKIVEAILIGTSRIQRKDGSFEEAYPRESSLAVTSLVVHNLLYSYFNYETCFTTLAIDKLKNIVEKAFKFLSKTPETHGVISNHLASIATATVLSQKFLKKEYDLLPISKVLALQNKNEGWFPEYGGADPGYQSLLQHYLHAGRSVLTDIDLEPLKKSQEFLEVFCFSDGQYSGDFGARGTTIFYPSAAHGNEFLLDWWMSLYIKNDCNPNPLTIDQNNFVPLLTSWTFLVKNLKEKSQINSWNPKMGDFYFEQAQLYVSKREKAELAVSGNNGAIKRLVYKENQWLDKSIASLKREDGYSQWAEAKMKFEPTDYIQLNLGFSPMIQNLNGPCTATLLRLMAWATSLFPPMQRIIKNNLAKYVMSRRVKVSEDCQIYIDLKSLDFDLQITGPYEKKIQYGYFSHMASANSFRWRS